MHDDDEKTGIRPVDPLLAAVEGRERQEPYLIVLTGKAVGRMFRLTEGELRIGRSPECDIMLDDEGVSRKHAVIRREEDGRLVIEDAGSTNGTWVEGTRVHRRVLKEGERVQLGSATILKYGLRDAAEEQVMARLYESAVRDPLTGLYNKRFLMDRLAQEVAWHQRHRQPLSLVLIDVDHFKRVNDTHGHLVGDRVLRRLVDVCRQVVRTEDLFARYGGEEFAVLLRQTTDADALVLGERMRQAVAAADLVTPEGASPIRVTLSVGVARIGDDASDVGAAGAAGAVGAAGAKADPMALVERADRRLYRAKALGRDRVVGPGEKPAAD